MSLDKDNAVVELRGAATGLHLHTLKHSRRPDSIHFSPDSKLLLAVANLGGKETIGVLWDTASGEHLHTLIFADNGRSIAYSVAFSPNSKRLMVPVGAFGQREGSVQIWDTNTGQRLSSVKCSCAIHLTAFSYDTQWMILVQPPEVTVTDSMPLVAGTVAGVRSTLTGQRRCVLDQGTTVTSVTLARDSRLAIIISRVQEFPFESPKFHVKVWDIVAGRCLHGLETYGLTRAVFSRDSKDMVIVSNEFGLDRVRLIQAADGSVLHDFDYGSTFCLAAFCRSSPLVLLYPWMAAYLSALPKESTVKVWDTATGMYRHSLGRGHGTWAGVVCADGAKTVAVWDTASEETTVQLWDTTTGKCRREFKCGGNVKLMVFSYDTSLLATTSN